MPVITFSRRFPATHPKAGEPTLFVQQILNALRIPIDHNYKTWLKEHNPNVDEKTISMFYKDLTDNPTNGVKMHTIRGGKNRKIGGTFSPRVWSFKPYNSPQITFAPDCEIKSLYDFQITPDGAYMIDGWKAQTVQRCRVAVNDGLSSGDFQDWFIPPSGKKFGGFKGQIIGIIPVTY
jgi:hypothetical protein